MTENQTNDQDTLFEFPCEFQIKAIGLAEESFELLVIEIISNHYNDLSEDSVQSRESSNGKYLSVSVHNYSRKQSPARCNLYRTQWS